MYACRPRVGESAGYPLVWYDGDTALHSFHSGATPSQQLQPQANALPASALCTCCCDLLTLYCAFQQFAQYSARSILEITCRVVCARACLLCCSSACMHVWCSFMKNTCRMDRSNFICTPHSNLADAMIYATLFTCTLHLPLYIYHNIFRVWGSGWVPLHLQQVVSKGRVSLWVGE